MRAVLHEYAKGGLDMETGMVLALEAKLATAFAVLRGGTSHHRKSRWANVSSAATCVRRRQHTVTLCTALISARILCSCLFMYAQSLPIPRSSI